MEPSIRTSAFRVALLGPESSGKSTMSWDLAEDTGAFHVPEYAREYLEVRQGKYEQQDLLHIARRQQQLLSGNTTRLVADTELLTIRLWSEIKYGSCDPEIVEMGNAQRFGHYFLCYPDLQWEEDPLREAPETTTRKQIFDAYESLLKEKGYPYTVIRGQGTARYELLTGQMLELFGA